MSLLINHSTPADGSFSATGATAWNATHAFTGVLDVANGGNGTATPALVAGANVTITGTWPNQTINSSGGGGSGTVTNVSVTSANGLAGTVTNPTTTPAISLSTTVTGLLKGNGTAISAATSGTDYAPATSGTSILYGDNAGGFSNVTVGTGLSFISGTLTATGSGTVTSVGATAPVASSGGATPTISLNTAYGDTLNPYASKTANYFLAAPNGTAGAPSFRGIVVNDIPTLNQNTTGSAGSVANSLTISSPLSGTSYNGSSATTIALAASYGDTQNPYASKTANYVLAAPNGTAGTPSFRALVSADIPSLNYQAPITLTTTGTSGAATFIGNTLNIPQYTGGSGSPNLDGGTPTSNYGGITAIDGGTP
jgi:hypothetical protein